MDGGGGRLAGGGASPSGTLGTADFASPLGTGGISFFVGLGADLASLLGTGGTSSFFGMEEL